MMSVAWGAHEVATSATSYCILKVQINFENSGPLFKEKRISKQHSQFHLFITYVIVERTVHSLSS